MHSEAEPLSVSWGRHSLLPGRWVAEVDDACKVGVFRSNTRNSPLAFSTRGNACSTARFRKFRQADHIVEPATRRYLFQPKVANSPPASQYLLKMQLVLLLSFTKSGRSLLLRLVAVHKIVVATAYIKSRVNEWPWLACICHGLQHWTNYRKRTAMHPNSKSRCFLQRLSVVKLRS